MNKEKLNDEFLETLVAAVEECGWGVDYYESAAFVKWVFRQAGREEPTFKYFED